MADAAKQLVIAAADFVKYVADVAKQLVIAFVDFAPEFVVV